MGRLTASIALLLGCVQSVWRLSAARPAGHLAIPNGSKTPVHTVEVIKKIDHDMSVYTQGLVYQDGLFYESGGLTSIFGGQSSLRIWNPETGEEVKSVPVPDPYFAEGLILYKQKLYQLTWQHHVGFVYDAETLDKVGDWNYDGEGWGLALHSNQSMVYMSDGTEFIRRLEPGSMRELLPPLEVTDAGEPISDLNELEFVAGEIWANVYTTNQIARIDPATGKVKSWLDCSELTSSMLSNDVPANSNHYPEVLNGVAYDPESKRLWITGKRWPKVYQVRVLDKSGVTDPPKEQAAPKAPPKTEEPEQEGVQDASPKAKVEDKKPTAEAEALTREPSATAAPLATGAGPEVEEPHFISHPLTKGLHIGFVFVCIYIVVLLIGLAIFEFWKKRQPAQRADIEEMHELAQYEH